jgi:hypothetical protein
MTFHAFVCFVQWLACMVGFVYGLIDTKFWPPLWYTSLIMWWAFPILNEAFLILKGRLLRGRVESASYCESKIPTDCIPLVYSPQYNLAFCGLEKMHPFDAVKYERVWASLIS